MSTTPLSTTDRFHATYQKLTRFEQIVLQTCSIIFDQADASTVLSCLYSIKIPTNINLENYPREVDKCFNTLIEHQLFSTRRFCANEYVELVSRKAVKEGTFSIIASAIQGELPKRRFPLSSADPVTGLRDLRIDLYNNNIEKFHQQLVTLLGEQRTISTFPIHPMVTICNNPFDPQWFTTLPVHIQFFAMHEIMKHAVTILAPLDTQVTYLIEDAQLSKQELLSYPSFLYLLISTLLLQGEIDQANQLINENTNELDSLGLKGWNLFIKGKGQESIKSFHNDLSLLRKLNNRTDAFFTGFEGLIFCLALLQNGQQEDITEVKSICETMQLQHSNIYTPSYKEIAILTDSSVLETTSQDVSPANCIATLFMALRNCTIKGRLSNTLEIACREAFEKSDRNGYHWLAMEFAEILGRTTDIGTYKEFALDSQKKTKVITIADCIKHKPRWQLALNDLSSLSTTLGKSAETGTCRIAWTIQADKEMTSILIIPREQRLSANGSWSKGRIISPKRLFHQEDLDYMSDHDKKICTFIRRQKTNNISISYSFDTKVALYNMAGHRNLFLAESTNTHLTINRTEPELRVTENLDTIKIEFFPFPQQEKIVVLRDDFSTLKVVEISSDHRKIAEIIGRHGLIIPQKAKKQVLRTIGKTAAHLNIFSDFEGIETPYEKIPADNDIHLQITPADIGFKVEMFVRPFISKGPYLKPGKGSVTIFFEIKNTVLQTTRNLQKEKENAHMVETKCPILALHEDGEKTWLLPEPNDCLEFLHSVSELDYVQLEWPQGEKLRLMKTAGSQSCQISIKRKNNWFEMDGTLQVDEEHVLSLGEVLKEIRTSGSRFIKMDNDDFLALTDELYECLTLIESASQEDGQKQIKITPLSATSLAKLSDSGIGIVADQSWFQQLDMIEKAAELKPEIPSTLQAILRDYQVSGFRWLMRLSCWGAGACLADDMGIGKTIQAMTVALAHASKGPSLVISPTSVCFNWQDEIKRFAPTLTTRSFLGDDRQTQLSALGPFDIFITSYGLLQQVPELADIEWQVIILDEGQAIKNRNTKRSAAAMKLNGKFKIITTGTPIENNLGELWNLFRFINPGLLGTYKQFNERFASPITKDRDNTQKIKLKNLIKPFILRRMKTQVLEELPSRTVVNLYVDFNEEETALYEALRRQSIQRIDPNDHEGHLRIRILAEIMKLRRACCNSQLVLPESTIKSSKLALFEETIDELLANNHKTLVFSQFVDHLTIIKDSLRRKKIHYHYLDGSTPAKTRKLRVDAFQAGDGDVFLISLRAGGMGLNLTAANYVIHMDPWWNPAVEDQASDRAHRIGQELPVTIYKFITRNTIEEKIVTLHQQKRELANTLLEETDGINTISPADLLALLQER